MWNVKSSESLNVTLGIPSNVTDDLSEICEQGDDEDDVPPTQNKSIKKKRKRTVCVKQSIKSFFSVYILLNFSRAQRNQARNQVLILK